MTSRKLGLSPALPPKFAVSLSSGRVTSDPKAIRAAIALMNQNAIIGGAAAHWGGPSAFCEINSVLFSIFFENKESAWFEEYNFINDAGHCENGIYAQHANYSYNNLSFTDLKHFRSVESKLTGHGEGHLYPEGVLVSNGPLGSAISQAQGLCASDKFIGNKRLTITTISDGAIMEGEAKEALSAIPGLAKKGKMNPFVLIISDNNTKLSGRIDEDSFTQTPTFDSLKSLGWDVFNVNDGHDLELLDSTITKALESAKRDPIQPIVILVKTIKGKGISFTEEMPSGGHGYPLKAFDNRLESFLNEIYQGEELPEIFNDWLNQIRKQEKEQVSTETITSDIKKQKIQVGVSQALIELKKEGLPIISITSDLAGSTGVAPFQKEFPESTFDVGVAESNMASMASGFSNNGMIPVIDTFAQFGVTKGNLPLIMANINQTPVIGIFSHSGFEDAADVASHQSTTYISAVASIPNTKVFTFSCSDQAHKTMTAEIKRFHQLKQEGKSPESLIFFLGRENFPESYPELKNQKHSETLLVACGSMLPQAIKAQRILEEDGVTVEVYDHYQTIPINTQELESIFKDKKLIITVEDHQVIGGAGSILATTLGYNYKFKHLGVNGIFGRSSYKAEQLYEMAGIDALSIVKKVKEYQSNQ